MNNFHRDSLLFFREVARGTVEQLDKPKVIQLAMNLALGCERLLKGILYDINPTYILNDPAFKNSVQILYNDQLLPGSKGSPELTKQLNGDVITFRNSLLRAQLVSATTEKHKNILFAISDARDVIAHCELDLLNVDQIKSIIQRDFFTMIKSYAFELNIKPSLYFESNIDRLSKIAISQQTDLSTKINMLIEYHRDKWTTAKENNSYLKKQHQVNEILLRQPYRGKMNCPACQQDAIVYFHPIVEMDPFILEMIIIGYEVKKLVCHYCKLQLDEPAILDHLGIKYEKVKNACLYCGELTKNGSGVCDNCDNAQEEQLDFY